MVLVVVTRMIMVASLIGFQDDKDRITVGYQDEDDGITSGYQDNNETMVVITRMLVMV